MTGKIIKKDDGTEPKVVEGGAISFDSTKSQPDTPAQGNLEQTVNTSNTTQSYAGLNLPSYFDKNMYILAERNGYVGDKDLAVLFSLAALANPPHNGEFSVAIKPIPSLYVKRYLEGNPKYGPDTVQTGIYGISGLNSERVNLFSLLEYFPEIESITKLNDDRWTIKENPFQYLLSLPVDNRAFLAGAVQDALQDKKIRESNGSMLSFYKPLATIHVLDYARKVGEIPKVSEYVKIYLDKK